MRYTFRVVNDRGQTSHLRFNPDDAEELGLSDRRQLMLTYGLRQEEVHCYPQREIPRGQVWVGHLAAAHLLLDTAPAYTLVLKAEQLIVGPVVGMMMRATEEELIRELDLVLPYVNNYAQVGGLVVLFANEQADYDTQTLTGYRYDPGVAGRLVKGTFPFPAVWFRRTGFKSTREWRRCRQIMGRRLINGYYFTKWEFWTWLSGIPEAAEHIAISSELITPENLDAFINRFGSVYIKPVMAHSGFGIEKITRDGTTYEVDRNYLDTVNLTAQTLPAYMAEHYTNHILQQPLELQRWEGRQITYRAIVQRDRYGVWQLTGLVGFFGGVGCITGNWSRNGGFLKPGLEALNIQCDGDEKKAFRYLSSIRDVTCRLAAIMGAEIDAYLDFGMDIGLDDSGKVWVIEANKRQHYETCEHVGDHQLHLCSMAQGLTSSAFLALQGV